MGYYKEIPVEERKPPIGYDVICVDSDGKEFIFQWTSSGWISFGYGGSVAVPSEFNITHWLEKVQDEKQAEFELVVRPVIKYLCDNHHPHTSVYITNTSAEVSEGVKVISGITDYIKD